MKILASIILYNPDLDRLENNISSIKHQVDAVLAIDNASGNISQIKAKFQDQLIIIENAENMGVAFALNQIFEFALTNEYSWVLTLDQDSVCYNDIIEKYIKYIKLPSAGILCCTVRDRGNVEYADTQLPDHEYEEVDKCITSGAFCSVEAYSKTKGFNNDMFIDLVDFDYCYKLQTAGYKIYRIKYVGLLHELGECRVVNFIGKQHVLTNHSPFRRYYIARNQILIARKYPEKMTVKRRLRLDFSESIWILLFEKEKFAKIYRLWKGVRDGFRMSLED